MFLLDVIAWPMILATAWIGYALLAVAISAIVAILVLIFKKTKK